MAVSPPPPSLLQFAVEGPRAAWTLATLAAAWRGLPDGPRGEGRPVLVLPGLFNTDRSNLVMRAYLRRLGYDAQGWGLGRNLGARTVGADAERVIERVRALHASSGQKVTLIGVSLGGIMARLAGHRHPELVRQVITVSSPFAGPPTATNVWRAFEAVTGEKISDPAVAARLEEAARPLPMPSTAIWSASDGFVNGSICREPGGANAVEVRSSHLFVQMKPEVLRAIAAALGAQR